MRSVGAEMQKPLAANVALDLLAVVAEHAEFTVERLRCRWFRDSSGGTYPSEHGAANDQDP